MRSRLLCKLALFAAGLLVAIPVVWACGPYLPNWILGPDRLLFEGPIGTFKDEVERLRSGGGPSFKAMQSESSYEAEILEAERADLERALAEHGTWTMLRGKVVENVVRLRQDMAPHQASLGDLLTFGMVKPGPTPSGLTVPKPLLPEFADYLEGAIAYNDGRLNAAVQAWERLRRRPAEQRRFRSTWAAFMIGKARIRTDPDRAVKSFQLTRELASKGFVDSLGLAASSLGWEAWAEAERKRYDRALVLYAQQMRTGDKTAYTSLKLTAPEALAAGPEALAAIARDPEARAILTAYFVSHDPDGGEDWQKALADAGVRDLPGADRLAWAAYLAGDFQGAAAWLDRAQEQSPPSPSSPIFRWVRARLLLRDGKLDEARDLLAGASSELRDLGLGLDEAFWISTETGEISAAPQRAVGEEAVIRLTQRDYTGALDRFLRSGYWLDAAYLAEQVLTLDELKAYVDATWPADLAAKYEPPKGEDAWEPLLVGGYTAPPPERLARDLRDLLGRRLAREGRLADAGAYLKPEHRPELASLGSRLAAGRDGKRPAADRARELFQAACLLRHQGMEITGTVVEPDWALLDGFYEMPWVTNDRDARRENRIVPVTQDETRRAERHRGRPWKRFHYRYRAADLAWDAAKLLPSGDEKAAMLATAGSWIGSRDPEAADRFYKQLVHCCGSTDLGRQADELRWFPEADACAMAPEP
ncbi:MAG TPA: hypothetical protein VN493_02705 [Thermoanaerobaculia bacterium]|nr:hypothetical protein [Thermoanaerobaculia bacterium]